MARALGLLAVTSVYAFTHDESAAGYASRYPELRARFCATDRCDTHALHDHYKNVGATEWRRWGCGSRFDAVSDLHVAPSPGRTNGLASPAAAKREAVEKVPKPARDVAAEMIQRNLATQTNCDSLECPFWDDGTRFGCSKVGASCLAVRSPTAPPRLNVTFVGDSLSIQHFTSLACMLWRVCRAYASYTRSVNGAHQRCHAVCGSHLYMQDAGTRYPGQRSTAHYLQLFSNLTDVQVYNEGLWWNNHRAAMQKMDDFMRVFARLPSPSRSRVIWRETSPQHFESGQWSQWYKHTPCAPLRSLSNPWASMRALGARHGCRVMAVWDLSAGF